MTFSLRHFLTGLFLGTSAALNFGTLPIQTIPVCVMQTLLSTPPGVGNEPMMIDRIAWPIGSPPLPSLLTINGQTPLTTDPELICMGGCQSPPCWPVLTCSAGDLYWSHLYDAVVVPANSQMRLPDMDPAIVPPSLLVLYDAAQLPPNLPSSTPIPTASPSPSRLPSPSTTTSPPPTLSPSLTPSVRPTPVIMIGPEPESPHATPAAIVFGILFGATSLIILYCWRQGRRPPCPYCEERVGEGSAGMRAHLKTCRDHLALFQPFVVDSVTAVTGRQLKQQDVVLHVTDEHDSVQPPSEKEDLISRAEPPGMVSDDHCDDHHVHQGVKE